MNEKTITYTVLAMVLGYSLVSILPSMFSSQDFLYQNEAVDKNGTETLGPPTFNGSEQRADDGNPAETDYVTISPDYQLHYIVLDLSIAFSIYYLARKRMA